MINLWNNFLSLSSISYHNLHTLLQSRGVAEMTFCGRLSDLFVIVFTHKLRAKKKSVFRTGSFFRTCPPPLMTLMKLHLVCLLSGRPMLTRNKLVCLVQTHNPKLLSCQRQTTTMKIKTLRHQHPHKRHPFVSSN